MHEMKDFEIEDRVNQAVDYFESGYNCAQSVFLSYSDLFNIEKEMAAQMTVSFGGGLARMRETCGTISAMAMLAGFRYPVANTQNIDDREKNYAIVQKMAALFKEKYNSIICRELLQTINTDTNPRPSERTALYYAKRPCSKIVVYAAVIAGKMIKGELEEGV